MMSHENDVLDDSFEDESIFEFGDRGFDVHIQLNVKPTLDLF